MHRKVRKKIVRWSNLLLERDHQKAMAAYYDVKVGKKEKFINGICIITNNRFIGAVIMVSLTKQGKFRKIVKMVNPSTREHLNIAITKDVAALANIFYEGVLKRDDNIESGNYLANKIR